jgi:hypothetical protein
MLPKPHKRAALYLAGAADADMRRAILTDEAKLKHWQVAATYHDTRGIRPELKRLQAAIMAGKVDALMVWDLTELGNGVLDVVETAAWLHAQGVYLYAAHPAETETHDVRGRARLELIAHLAEFQARIRFQCAKAVTADGPPRGPGGASRHCAHATAEKVIGAAARAPSTSGACWRGSPAALWGAATALHPGARGPPPW